MLMSHRSRARFQLYRALVRPNHIIKAIAIQRFSDVCPRPLQSLSFISLQDHLTIAEIINRTLISPFAMCIWSLLEATIPSCNSDFSISEPLNHYGEEKKKNRSFLEHHFLLLRWNRWLRCINMPATFKNYVSVRCNVLTWHHAVLASNGESS